MKGPSEAKKKVVEELAHDIDKYKTVGILDMHELPATQLQQIRNQIRDKAKIKMERRKLINLSLEKSKKPEAKKLIDNVKGMAALLFSEEDAFALFKTIKKNRSNAPAKPGQISPKKLTIKAGPTSFTPGPMISELGKFGIKTKVEKGKLTILNEKTVAEEGDEITPEMAELLGKFDIKPMRIGVNLICALEGKDIFLKEILDINEDEFINNIKNAYLDSLKLGIGAKILNKETTPSLIEKAHTEAKKLAIGAEIINNETRDFLIKKAESQANALKSKTND